jgi:Zn-dependent protease
MPPICKYSCLLLPVTTADTIRCPRCAAPLGGGALVCNRCGALVYASELQQLAEQAQGLEQSNPPLAASMWRQCLPYLPADSAQHAAIVERAGALAAGFGAPGPALNYARPSTVASDDFTTFVLKTGGSMALSIALFAWSYDWQFAVAFVLLIFIHEMGHVVANWYFGLKQSAPIFLGYFGAVIFLRESPRDATVEGIVGIAGPVAGTIGALACYVLYLRLGTPELLEATAWGFFINAWNLLPIPPLDGGRAAAALSPFLWVLGIIGLVAVEGALFMQYHSVSFIGIMVLLWVFQSTLPRLRETLFNGGWRSDYYRTSITTKLAMGLTYLALLAILIPQLLRFHPWSQL